MRQARPDVQERGMRAGPAHQAPHRHEYIATGEQEQTTAGSGALAAPRRASF